MNLQVQDKYIIEWPEEEQDWRSLYRVYQRLIGASALALYGFLWHGRQNKQEEDIQSLCDAMSVTLAKCDQDLTRLEQFDLLEIYVSYNKLGNHYIFKLKPALHVHDFLKHEVFGRLFIQVCGASQYEYILEQNTSNALSKEGYEIIRHPVDKAFLQNWTTQAEQKFVGQEAPKNNRQDLSFDIKTFLVECSLILFPKHYRTQTAIDAIKEIGSIYGISVRRMVELVGKAYVANENSLNIKRLRSLASKEVVSDVPVVNSPYEYPPVIFLKKLRKDIEPTALEKYLLNQLVSVMGLNPQVVNVLIEASFKANRQVINTRNVEMIAMQWATLNINTLEKAKAQASQSFKSNTKRRVEKTSDYPEVKQESMSFEEEKALMEAFMKLGEE